MIVFSGFLTLTVTYPGEQRSKQQGKVYSKALDQHEGGSEEHTRKHYYSAEVRVWVQRDIGVSKSSKEITVVDNS